MMFDKKYRNVFIAFVLFFKNIKNKNERRKEEKKRKILNGCKKLNSLIVRISNIKIHGLIESN